MSLNTERGKEIQHLVCEECKEKIRLKMTKLSKFDLLRPQKLATKFAKLLCPACAGAVRRHYPKKNDL